MPAPVTSGQAMPAEVMAACAARASPTAWRIAARARPACAGAARRRGRPAARRKRRPCDDDLVRDAHRRRRRHAAAPVADVDLDEHIDHRPSRLQRLREPVDAERRVDGQRQPHAAGQRGQRRELGGVDDLVADVDVVHAGLGQRLCFREFLHAHADGAGSHLQPGDGGALVRLGVRPQAHAVRARELGHALDVALHRVEIDHQRRRVDGRHRVADPCCLREVHAALPCAARFAPASLNSSCTAPSRWPVSAQPTSVKPCGV